MRLVGTNLVLFPILNSLFFLKFGKLAQSIPTSNVAAGTVFSSHLQICVDCRNLLSDDFAEVQIKLNCNCTYKNFSELSQNGLKCVSVIKMLNSKLQQLD